jgi:hypothetical protein
MKLSFAHVKESVMGGFDVRFAPCEAVREMVILDQTQEECAQEHLCPQGRICPLDGCFAEYSGLFECEMPLFLSEVTKH